MDANHSFDQLARDYALVEQAILFLQANAVRQPDLGQVAAAVGLSEYHFQRLFTRWAGISPKRFLQFLTREHAKRLLEKSSSLLEVTYAVGLSSPGRLHDLFISTEAVTPGEYKTRGQGLTLRYGLHPTPFGECLLAASERGVCRLAFIDSHPERTLAELRAGWADARLIHDPAATAPLVERVFTPAGPSDPPLRLLLRGTNFQLKVWEALLAIPPGAVTSYQALAWQVDSPESSRAVGGALARNPLAVLIPCHRVLRKAGGFGGYRYGSARKLALLGRELAHTTA
jgi:AraC family transcriptional regulator, regulatory protein of adaptative response / methylated-DNA-[protein]-cysteine methyltransferase